MANNIKEKLNQWRDKCATNMANHSVEEVELEEKSCVIHQLNSVVHKIKHLSPSLPESMELKDIPPLM
nr:hypothetical protein [Vibrio cholerae]